MLKDFTSHIIHENISIDTILDGPNIAFGETLSAKLYIEGDEIDEIIDEIVIELIKVFGASEKVIAKHSIEMVSGDKSKETWMIPFEMVPDERWETKLENESLTIRTTVYLKNDILLKAEDKITYK
ncbi:sporulation protein [Sporosarcina sp. FA9]|uniref:sporulation protein n=1 Tax=Sporosarcina sp. FA9 TaxID=3413030 RepID=UPI003F65F058